MIYYFEEHQKQKILIQYIIYIYIYIYICTYIIYQISEWINRNTIKIYRFLNLFITHNTNTNGICKICYFSILMG